MAFLFELGQKHGNAPTRTPKNQSDLVIRDCRLVNILSREIYPADIEISGNTIYRIRKKGEGRGRRIHNANRAFAVPGLMDAHLHTEATLLTLARFTEAVLPGGTTTFFANPHEIANVLSLKGVRWMLRDAGKLPIRLFLIAPCKVPTAPRLETSGAEFGRSEIEAMAQWPDVVGFGEFNGDRLLAGEPRQHRLLRWTRPTGKILAGHAPHIRGDGVAQLRALGIHDDHESTTFEEVRDRLRLGMTVFLREGSTERSLNEILPKILEGKISTDQLCFCTDDKHPDDLLTEGDIDHHVREAIRLGMDPIDAIRCATWNCAVHYGLDQKLGALTPGRLADIVLLKNLKKFNVQSVFVDGKLEWTKGRSLQRLQEEKPPSWAVRSVKLPSKGIRSRQLFIGKKMADGITRGRVIEIHPTLPTTQMRTLNLKIRKGEVQSDTDRDILKIVVVDRHSGHGTVGTALVKGFGLKSGALGSSVAHDHHNLIVVGTSDREILAVIQHLQEMQGGLIAVRDGKLTAQLPLPIAGLLSDYPVDEVVKRLKKLKAAAKILGCELPNPFMTLSFVSLPTIPECGLTDRGLVDVLAHKIVSVLI